MLEASLQLEEALIITDNLTNAMTHITEYCRETDCKLAAIIHILSYLSFIRPMKSYFFRDIVHSLASDDVIECNLSQSDKFFVFCNIEKQCLISCSPSYLINTTLMINPPKYVQYLFGDDPTGFFDNLTNVKPDGFSSLLDFICFCGSEKCFDVYYDNYQDTVTQITCAMAYISGSIYIINKLKEKHLSRFNNELCFKYAIEGHQYQLSQSFNIKPNLTLLICSFSSFLINQSVNKTDFQTLKIYGNKFPLCEHIKYLRGEQYLNATQCLEPFIQACINKDKNTAIQLSIPNTEYFSDFHFQYEDNSCYCNAFLRFLFSLPEVQSYDFLHSKENKIPNLCEFQLSIIQYLIRKKKHIIKSTYFRFYTQEDSGFVFGTQNDLNELIEYIGEKCTFIHDLFVNYSKSGRSIFSNPTRILIQFFESSFNFLFNSKS